MPYIGGFPVYVNKCNDVMANGYEGFVIEGARTPNAKPRIRWTERWLIDLDLALMSLGNIAAGRVPMV